MNLVYNIVLWFILVISFVGGINIFANAKSAIHEIYGAISFLIAILILCTIAIRSKMSENTDRIIEELKNKKEVV